VFAVMSTWQRGHEIVTAERTRREGSLREFVDRLRKAGSSTLSVPGTAVFLNRGKQTVPLAMRTNVEYNHVRHEHVVIVTVETKPVPRVPAAQRLVVDDLGHDDGITHVCVRFGYLETPDVPAALRALTPAATEGRLQLDEATYFLSTIELERGDAPTMATWRKRLFIATSSIAADDTEHFALPRDRTIVMSSRVEV
jgi:KUP system potassium uptake protein